jgi:hypothetical protein
MKTAVKMEANPIQVSQPIWWNLRTEAARATKTVATRVHQTVHAAWWERALIPMDTPTIPEPVRRT